jgi:hypothetical protein
MVINEYEEGQMPAARTKPSSSPPGAKTSTEADTIGTTEPKPLTDEQLTDVLEPEAEGRPTLDPASAGGVAAAAEAAGAVTATWRTGVTITALWSINELRNAWMHVAGLGWRKLYNGRDAAFTQLVTLASHARQTGRQVSFREEADGMVYEIYVW